MKTRSGMVFELAAMLQVSVAIIDILHEAIIIMSLRWKMFLQA
jgi:hypothetical protein